jgi:hypothetical protein
VTDLARYTFVPWVRRGYQPSGTESLSDPIEDPPELSVSLTAEGSGSGNSATREVSLDVDMYGPGDVVGLDSRQVVRMEPEPETGDFEPNYFPMVEFDRATLPWLFSPVSGDDDGKLRPWCCLVVVEQQEGVSLSASGEAPVPTLTIEGPASPAAELPDPMNSWAWAHAQVVGSDESPEFEFRHDTTRSVARLVAPRRLEPGTSYHACVVPTFEPGRLAGLGREPYPGTGGDTDNGDSGGRDGDIAMAWSLDDLGDRIQLPVYHTWEFSTGREGDFESLVRDLEPAVLDGLGYRDVDASEPGVAALSTRRTPTDVRVEGALKSPELDELSYPPEMRAELRSLANAEDPDDDGRPTFGPPIYGRYHADVGSIPEAPSSGDPSWIHELNVDPRHRIAAGFGVEVVREQQEALVASAWDQVGEVRAANAVLRRARLSRESSTHVHDDLSELSPAATVSATAGMHDRATWTGTGGYGEDLTFAAAVENSRVPAGVTSPAVRRLLRPDGPIRTAIGSATPTQPELLEAFDAADPVSVERDGSPDGAVLMTREPQDGTEYGGFDDLCTAVQQQESSEPSPAVLHRRVGTDRGALRDECWQSATAAKQAVAAMGPTVSGGDAGQLLAALDRRLLQVADTRGGSFTPSTNRLAGLDAKLADDAAAPTLQYAGALGDDLDAILTGAGALDRLADDLQGSTARIVRTRSTTLRAAIEQFQSALAVRLFYRLDLIGNAAQSGVLDAVSGSEETAVDVRTAIRVAFGAATGPPLAGVAERFEQRVRSTYHRGAVADCREIRRLVGIAAEAARTLAADGGHGGAEAADACDELDAVFELIAGAMGQAGSDPVWSPISDTVCTPTPEQPQPGPQLGLGDAADALLDATDPESAIPNRIAARIGGLTETREDPLDQILAAPAFPKPMYEELAALSQEYLLPGVGDVPKESVGVLETNPAFVRAFMVGLNDEMAREFRWREYPTDMRGTYFDRFWGAEGAIPKPSDPADIEPLHTWDVEGSFPTSLDDPLARDDDATGGGNVVLTIRGELLRRYPNTTIYAAKATYEDTDGDGTPDERVPDLPTGSNDEAPDPTDPGIEFPMFRGHLEDDMTFFGFDVGVDEARGSPDDKADPGWFFVIEEAPGEPRLGLDVNQGDVGANPPGIRGATGSGPGGGTGSDSGWSALSWGHMVPDEGDNPLEDLSYIDTETARPGVEDWSATAQDAPVWGRNGADMAAITWQKPFRIAIHAADMLPADEDGGGGP